MRNVSCWTGYYGKTDEAFLVIFGESFLCGLNEVSHTHTLHYTTLHCRCEMCDQQSPVPTCSYLIALNNA